MAQTEEFDRPSSPAWEARKLLRAIRVGTLATAVREEGRQGQPFASLVTPACTPGLSILLFLSDLSEHTRHLMADPRCSMLVSGAPVSANPQTAPRVTVTGLAETTDDPAMKARFLAVHPYASLYADFTDFRVWLIRPMAALFVGGFARAERLKAGNLVPDDAAVGAISAAEAGIIRHCNEDHPAALAAIAGRPGAWRMVAVDLDGCDLALDEQVVRIPWSAPTVNAAGIRAELVRLAAAARGMTGG
jgi:putative heme iron utilization protein